MKAFTDVLEILRLGQMQHVDDLVKHLNSEYVTAPPTVKQELLEEYKLAFRMHL